MGVRKEHTIDNKEVSELYLQKALRAFRSNPVYLIENLYVFRWESDMLIKTKSGYWYEIECKISLADFHKDFEKIEKHEMLSTGEYWTFRGTKRISDSTELELYDYPGYKILKDGKEWIVYSKTHKVDGAKRPNYFLYCVPWYLEDKVFPLIPEYAGLVVMSNSGSLKVVKQPPLLHKEKYTDQQLNLCEKFYYRWRKCVTHMEQNSQRETINYLRNQISFLKAEYKAATGYDIKEVF